MYLNTSSSNEHHICVFKALSSYPSSCAAGGDPAFILTLQPQDALQLL